MAISTKASLDATASYRAGERSTAPVKLPAASTYKDPLIGYMATLNNMQYELTNLVNENNATVQELASTAKAAKESLPVLMEQKVAAAALPITPATNPANIVDPNTGLTPSTSTEIIKAILRGRGYPENLISSSTEFLNALTKDHIPAADAVEIFLNSPSYTTNDGKKLTSSFYETYGKYNEGLTTKYDAGTLFNTVEGYKSTVTKYGLNSKFTSPDSITNLLKNNVSVATFDERANAARLKAVTNDPFYTQALKDLGYISGAQDLTDFYMDAKIGTEALQQKRSTAAFTTEALRQAQGTGIRISKDYMERTAAELANLGYSEAEIAKKAEQGYANIAANLEPTTTLAGIYLTPRTTPGTYAETNAAYNLGIQQELQAQEFQGLASQRRKTLAEQEAAAFAGSAGLSGTSAYLRKTSLSKGTLGAL